MSEKKQNWMMKFLDLWDRFMIPGTGRLQKIAEALSWDYYQNYPLPIDIQTKLMSDSRLFSMGHYCLETVHDAFVGKTNGVKTYIFNCPIVMSNKLPYGSGWGKWTTPITVLLLITSKEIPRFFISKGNWGDKYCDPILTTDSITILGDSREDLVALLQPNSLSHYERTSNLAVEGKGDFAMFYYANDPVWPRGYLPIRKEDYFKLIAEAEFIIETFNLGKSWEEKIDIAKAE